MKFTHIFWVSSWVSLPNSFKTLVLLVLEYKLKKKSIIEESVQLTGYYSNPIPEMTQSARGDTWYLLRICIHKYRWTLRFIGIAGISISGYIERLWRQRTALPYPVTLSSNLLLNLKQIVKCHGQRMVGCVHVGSSLYWDGLNLVSRFSLRWVVMGKINQKTTIDGISQCVKMASWVGYTFV